MILFSILICTLPERKEMFESLYDNLIVQIKRLGVIDAVEILSNDSTDITTGKKRNILLEQASGKFSAFIDDDDLVSDDYIEKIVSCIEANPEIDCIGIKGQITFNGLKTKDWEISIDFGRWYEDNKKYCRTPNHISPIKTTIAKKVNFIDVTVGEDIDFSQRILPLLKKEHKLDGNIYWYRYMAKDYIPTIEYNFPDRPAYR